MSDWEAPHSVVLAGGEDGALAAVEEAVETWGGAFERRGRGGRVSIPVAVGLRHGRLDGDVHLESSGPATKLVLTPTGAHYRLHRPAAVVMLFGALGGLLLVVAPLWPKLFELVPAAVVLLLAAWFMVASRTRTRGPRDFLDLVESIAETPPRP